MNRRLLILDVVLLLFAGGLIWMLRQHYLEARARESAVLNKKVPPKAVLAPPVPAVPRSGQPSEYVDIAQKMLFSKDRNPNVVVEAPKPPPEPPMPALPVYHGQMDFGEPVALLSLPTQNATQKGYHAGETVGDFKLVAFDRDKIELEWHGKKVERKPEDLAPKEPPPPPAPVAAQPGVASPRTQPGVSSTPVNGASEAPAAPVKAVTSLGGSSSASGSDASGSQPTGLGAEIAPGVHNCLPGDDSPAGTVLSGYQKRLIPSMFGSVCRWEQVK